MKKIFQFISYATLVATMLAAPGCKKDFTDPSTAASSQVFNSAKGMAGVAVGLQKTYVNNVAYGMADANGLITNETYLLNPGNTSELQLTTGGGAVDGTNGLLINIWTSANKVIYDANNVIAGAATLSDKGYASGLIGYATIYKALSLGCLSEFWEKVPDTVGTTSTAFSDRMIGYSRAVAAIDKALTAISSNAISSVFLSDIPTGVDIVNTLNALKARYLMASGNYAGALAAANAVNLSNKSVMSFDGQSPNPIYATVSSTNNIYQPLDSTLGLAPPLSPDLSDKRVPFYTIINTVAIPKYRLNGFWLTATTAMPLYFPSEMTLIKAEAYARQTTPDLVNGTIELNKIVTKKAAADPLGIGADLPPVAPATVAELLVQIYRNRCIELYLSGLKLEDMRRFGRPNTERKRNLFPYPFRERDSNTNTPPDPAF